MGETLPVLDGLALAAAHLPGPLGGTPGDGTPGGETWYDITPTDDGQVAIAIGNVGGAAPGAAAQLCRAAAALGPGRGSPSGMLAGLDGAARGIPGCAGSTALCLTLDASGVLRWSGAGHSAPLVVGPDGARHLDGGQGGALAEADRAPSPQAEETLVPGTTVVLGTDGAGLVDGLDPVVDALARCHELAPDALAALAVATAQGDGAAPPGPGRTLVLVRLMPAPLEQRLPADPRRLSALRRTVAAWSALAALSEDTTADLQLLLSEAATNAIEHAYREAGAGEFVYSVLRRRDGGIRVVVQDFGRWQPPPDDPGYRGRGLAVIHNLADEVDLEHSDRGTRIAFTVPGDAAPLGDRPLDGVTQGWKPAGGHSVEENGAALR